MTMEIHSNSMILWLYDSMTHMLMWFKTVFEKLLTPGFSCSICFGEKSCKINQSPKLSLEHATPVFCMLISGGLGLVFPCSDMFSYNLITFLLFDRVPKRTPSVTGFFTPIVNCSILMYHRAFVG